jgi:dCMP deaminase
MAKKTKKTSREKVVCQNCLAGTCKLHSEPPLKIKRPSWDDYFMDLAAIAGTRSTCLRHKLGGVMVKNKRIIATGYNGAPRGMKHCLDVGCLRDKLKIPSGTQHEICRGVHAEQNLIIQAALHGASPEGSDVFLTHGPCAVCAKILINAGAKRIIYKNRYPDNFARKLLKQAKVQLIKLNQGGKKKKKT